MSDFLKDAGKGQQALSCLWAGLAWLWPGSGLWAALGSWAALGWFWAVLSCSGLVLGSPGLLWAVSGLQATS